MKQEEKASLLRLFQTIPAKLAQNHKSSAEFLKTLSLKCQ
jgi:hypothetical protein